MHCSLTFCFIPASSLLRGSVCFACSPPPLPGLDLEQYSSNPPSPESFIDSDTPHILSSLLASNTVIMSDTDSAPQGKPAPSDSEASDPGYRSRSQSRRSRRRKQQNQKQQQQQKPQTIEEDPEPEPEPEDTMQPFNHIGPDETSMDGPVT